MTCNPAMVIFYLNMSTGYQCHNLQQQCSSESISSFPLRNNTKIDTFIVSECPTKLYIQRWWQEEILNEVSLRTYCVETILLHPVLRSSRINSQQQLAYLSLTQCGWYIHYSLTKNLLPCSSSPSLHKFLNRTLGISPGKCRVSEARTQSPTSSRNTVRPPNCVQ